MFKRSGVLGITYWERGHTCTADSYIKDCLIPLVERISQERRCSGARNLKFHHDNARPHVAKEVIEYLKSEHFAIMDHPAYSPDLAPSDFWLFDYVKKQLTDHLSEESLVDEITKIVNSISKAEFAKTFDKWVERMKLCIKHKGHYFEHS